MEKGLNMAVSLLLSLSGCATVPPNLNLISWAPIGLTGMNQPIRRQVYVKSGPPHSGSDKVQSTYIPAHWRWTLPWPPSLPWRLPILIYFSWSRSTKSIGDSTGYSTMKFAMCSALPGRGGKCSEMMSGADVWRPKVFEGSGLWGGGGAGIERQA